MRLTLTFLLIARFLLKIRSYSMKKKIIFFLSFFILTGCAYLGYVKDPFVDIPQFVKVEEGLYRGGQPNSEGWEKLKDLGIRSVISLRGKDEELIRNREKVLSWGMNFYHIPLSVYRRPTDEEVLRFLEIVLSKENRPVFVYCTQGRDRTGAMIAMYRVVARGWSLKQAYREAKDYGFWPYKGETPELKSFIHQLKDKPIYYKKAKELLDKKNN